MRAVFHSLLILILLGFIFQSCDRKSCENVVCSGFNQTCVDGNCVCMSGYEGSNCDVETRLKYLGQYQVSENCTTSAGGFINNRFTANITSSRVDILTINNFTVYGGYIDANIVDATTLYIQEQRTGGIEVSGGQGTYQVFNGGIKLEYNYTISGNFHSCTAFYSPF